MCLRERPSGVVLVVDDDAGVRETVVDVLIAAGLSAQGAADSASALIRQEEICPDLALVDYQLPGESGIELARKLKAADPDLAVVAFSGHPSLESAVAAVGVAEAYLTKPIQPDQLLLTVRDRLDHRRLVTENRRLLHELQESNALLEARVDERARQLSASEARFSSLVEFAPDAIVIADASGRIVLVNERAEQLFGYSREELMGRPVELLYPADRTETHGYRAGHLERPMVGSIGEVRETLAKHRDGTDFPVDLKLSTLETEQGLVFSAFIRDATDRKRAEAALAYQATHDALTGLPNRALLDDRLELALARARRTGTTVAVLFMDVDRLKVINDSHGHPAGDQLLQVIAARLLDAMPAGETLARFGGDEFVVVSERADPDYAPGVLAGHLAATLATPVILDGIEVTVTASIGVAVAGPEDSPESLLRDADAAMYQAKDQGGDRCVVFDSSMRRRAARRLETESSLRRALECHELCVYYQPIIELTTGKVVGVEALSRWLHPEYGLLLPAEYINVAEDTGLVIPLGTAALREACHQVADWLRQVPTLGPLSVSVNLSARQLLTPGLDRVVEDVLATSGLDPRLLGLEITESVLLEDAELSSRALRSVKALGIRVGVDDFGTGYSSLTYLKRFPVDMLKIDKTFVDGLRPGIDDGGDRAIVASVIDLAHAFGLATVAEGVETSDQLEHLNALGCEQAQGYLWSTPLPAPAALQWIQAAEAKGGLERNSGLSHPEPQSLGVLVVEDDASLRRLLRLVIDDRVEFHVIAEAEDGRQAVALARHYQPDLVLLDLAMPGVGGLEALPLIKAVAPETKVVVLSGLEAETFAAKAHNVGALGFFTKGADPASLVDHLGQLLAQRV